MLPCITGDAEKREVMTKMAQLGALASDPRAPGAAGQWAHHPQRLVPRQEEISENRQVTLWKTQVGMADFLLETRSQ